MKSWGEESDEREDDGCDLEELIKQPQASRLPWRPLAALLERAERLADS